MMVQRLETTVGANQIQTNLRLLNCYEKTSIDNQRGHMPSQSACYGQGRLRTPTEVTPLELFSPSETCCWQYII